MERKPASRTGSSEPDGPGVSARAQNNRPENFGFSAAIAICDEAVGHGGTESGAEVEDGAKWNHEIAALTSWATLNDLWVPQLVPREVKDAGTREHLLFYREEEPGRIFKLTKGPGFGVFPASLASGGKRRPVRYWFADRAASPSEYLRRQWLSNLKMMAHLNPETYPVLTRLEGFVRGQQGFHIVTSQPVFDGAPAEETETANWFQAQGFTFVKAYTWFRQLDGLAVFDTWRDNVMVCSGQIVPFDVIPIQAKGVLRETLEMAATRVNKS
jgi:hypothetical protein